MPKIITQKFLLFAGALVLLFLQGVAAKKPVCLFKAGDVFPDFTFKTELTAEEIKYLGVPQKIGDLLGLTKKNSFSLIDIKADLIIVEFLNVYCVSCQAQAPVMNEVFRHIQKDAHLKERVKIFGVAAGNSLREIKRFKKEKQIPFPLIPDQKFDAYEAIGDPCGTPFLLLVRKSADKQGIITWSHIGLINAPLYFVQEAWDALNSDLAAILAKDQGKSSQQIYLESPGPFITEEELQQKVKESMQSFGLMLAELKEIQLSESKNIFMGRLSNTQEGDRFLFAKMVSRNPVCDICHTVHFILTFDEAGNVVDFVPIHITKYGNVPWNQKEIQKTKRKLIGKSILNTIEFNPDVDAVSRATMTSALIFNAVERAGRDYMELQEKGYLQ